ncbi:hypothetical protein [Xanthobacter agilis]|uniref:Uncharacterized protein n=1 Tax=Xanthobacter agilis TaxID=47492 RepID=A0ABU0LBX0_XANAG|nr:hypothetical protein [Xanthobacter agilis]MDQ0504634.1 hypothetical protein [Xanthobacter agilis]
MSGTANEIHLHLSDVKNFFQVPEIDPFEGDDLDVSGVAQLMDALKAQSGWKKKTLCAIVHLPREDAFDSRVSNMTKYIERYCDKNIQYNRRKITELRLEGRHALRMGTLFLFVCLGLSAATEAVVGAESLLGRVLVEGFIIAGWVGLWHPLELLLYAWWPNAQDIRLYEKIKSMRLDFAFDHELA